MVMEETDARSGFCKSKSVFYSKRKPLPLPQNYSLDVTTFISSRAHHGKIAFIDAATGRHFTFPQLWRAVDAVATSLSDVGIRKGHVVLLLSPNSIYFPVVCLAVMSLGAIITTTNPLNTAREIAKQISDSKPSLAFTIRPLLPKITAVPNLPIVLMEEDSNAPITKPKIVTTLGKMMKTEPRPNQVRDRVYQDDTATLLYSPGTTGPSKGVVSSHRNLMAMVQIVLGRFNMDKEETFICTVHVPHIWSSGVRNWPSGFRIDHSGAVQVRHGRYAIGDPEVPGDLPATSASYTGGDDERCGRDQGEVRLELATFGTVWGGTTEQGGDRGLCGQVPECHNSPGLRVGRIHGSRGIHGLTGREPEIRHGWAVVAGHRGQSRRP